MKNLLPNLLMVLGFCVGAVGATGFHSPSASANAGTEAEASTEKHAWTLLISGIALLGVGAFLNRGAKGGSLADGKAGIVASIQKELGEIQTLVAGLDASKDSLENAELMRQIDEMRTGVLFDLGSRSDSLASQIGFDAYAKIWGDFATCERLLNRSWSMAADGHGGESRAEIPLAREAINSAVASCASLA